MAKIAQPWLFSWKEIEVASDLDRLSLVLSILPDEPLVCHLEKRRGKGRNDYPIRPIWNALMAGIVFQHQSVEQLRRELSRNGELRQLCGFCPFGGARAVPSKDAFSRFLELIIKQRDVVLEMFHELVDELKKELPNLGKTTAVDSKALPSFGKPVRDTAKQAEEDLRRDTDADWGVKKYTGIHKDGSAWEKITKWFGYKLHLIVDSGYELPLAFHLDVASSSDTTNLTPLVDYLQDKHPIIYNDIEETTADKGYDSAENNQTLWDDHGIKPIIDTRVMWKSKTHETLFPERYDVFSFDEKGRIYCTCPSERRGEDERRELAFVGFEKDRACLKFRCPAAAFGSECPGRVECEKLALGGVGPFGRIVRVPLDTDRRIFTPVARTSAKWGKAYKRRTSVERVFSRIDQVLGFERHTIRGKQKMETRVTLALVIMLAMALGRIRQGQRDQMLAIVAMVKPAA